VDQLTVEALTAALPEARGATVEVLRRIVRRAVPDAVEAVRPGWGMVGYRVPAGTRRPYFGGIWPEWEHVHLMFEYGVLMDDPEGVLQGSGRQVRWVTLLRPDDLPAALLTDLVREAARVALLGRPERLARMLDRGSTEVFPVRSRA
jgi:hypothetical protein